jgi:hypothetical protein
MGRYLAIAIALSAVACANKKQNQGLQPAQEWNADVASMAPQASAPANPHGGGDPNNPHAGVDMTNPHGGGDPSNPHAGVDMTNPHGGDPSNPHAGVDMSSPHGADVSGVADPGHPSDPAHHVAGVLKIHPKAKDRVKQGGVLFLTVKRADQSGQPTGSMLAVAKLAWTQDGQRFELESPQLTGDVVVIAHYDQDGDASSHQPGDVVGQIKVRVPADGVNLFLDDVVQ